jgi:dephospho-CoA kinase
MILLALTGSIGMGKSTTAAMFADEGVPVWDADEAVARLYGPGGGAVAPLAEIAPRAIADNAVDRAALRRTVAENPGLLPRIEAAVHPLVAADRAAFLAAQTAPLALCDIPLLFETGGDAAFDAIVVVSAPPEVQKARVMARPGMTEALFAAILAKQTPDAEKRARADFIIDTSLGKDAARDRVREILDKLRNGQLSERT